MSSWDTLYPFLLKIRERIVNETKRAIKKQVPKTKEVRAEIRDSVIILFNKFTQAVASSWSLLREEQRAETKRIFSYVRDRVIRAFQALNVNYKVPHSPVESLDTSLLEDDLETDTDDETTMALTVIEFFNLASKLVPNEYDGNPDKVQSIVDSLTLLQLNAGEFQEQAVAFVKTKLIGKARDIVGDAHTLADIIRLLNENIKYENSSVISAKLLNIQEKPNAKQKFINEIEELSSKLQKAYITEGVPSAVAQKYVTDATVKSVSQNAVSDKAKIIVAAGNFQTVHDVLTKFATITPDLKESQICHIRHNNSGRSFLSHNSRTNNNQRSRNHANPRHHPKAHRSNDRQFYHNHQNNRYRRSYYHNNGNRANNRSTHFVRTYDSTDNSALVGNYQGPHQDHWGDENQNSNQLQTSNNSQ